jgi:hypothetical protein
METNTMAKTFKSGEISPESGIAERLGPKGGKLPGEVTVIKGKPFPPTPKPNITYKIVKPTPHRHAK